ncbi:hypothetical protein EC957_006508 [Mortierella hygrophila]|uniref:Uncharacterized protein n=1 Tax=Mortierella hygrophila TaxID=979708 RepID=A0A9P6K8N6_9FUNG|nr:hypothetical protein EC957_006508 [Mortierella hygrophila]
MATATTSTAANPHSPPPPIVTAQDRLLAACPCLNVKLHIATAPEEHSSLAGKELKLGLAGVSVEQKILCTLSISKDQGIVRCANCDHDVYTFQSDINSVNIESTSLVFVASSVPFSPSNGIVVPSEGIVTGEDIAALRTSPHYSVAFRLVLAPSTLSPTETQTATFTPDQPLSATSTASRTQQSETPYRPHLDKVRAILDQELEVNLNAQQQRTEARIEAYKSQQLMALKRSIENTRRDKERLWARIQDRVAPPPPAFSLATGDPGSGDADGSLDANGTHPFDIPSTLPIRLTSASRVDGAHSSFLDRRKGSISDAAMSLQFKEFDHRLASNSLRRQSLAPVPSTTDAMAELTLNNTTANAATERSPLSTSQASPGLGDSDDIPGSPTTKSKKKVTIAEDVRSMSIVEPEKDEYSDLEGEAEDDDDEGVVFDLDEELGFDDDVADVQYGEIDDDQDESDNEEDGAGPSTDGHGINIKLSSSIPAKSGMVVGSLRANYLKRQKGLEVHRRNLNDSLADFDSDDDEDDDDLSAAPPAFFGTSLPIQIQPRASSQLPPPPARTSAIASSLAMPPGSSPAAAMLQRRLSRAYGAEVIPENTGNSNVQAQRTSASGLGGSFRDVSSISASAQPLLGATPGTLIIDPLMLLEEEHDNDDRQDRLRKHRQPFSAINHRRDQEKSKQEQKIQETAASWSQRVAAPSHVSEEEDFEPPHLYSARTYVGATPWEMPTRITVKSGGMQREGSHLDKQIALEMAKELEKERLEAAATAAAAAAEESLLVSAAVVSGIHRLVEKIDETEEEEDEEDQVEESARRQTAGLASPASSQHPFDT